MDKYLHKYRIAYKNLSKGEHKFQYTLDNKFFECFPFGEIKKASILVDININVGTNNLILNFNINGQVNVNCDLCLNEFLYDIKYKDVLFVEISDFNSDITDVEKNITISKHDNYIDLSQHLYEYVHLALPIRKVHPNNGNNIPGCKQEDLETINKYLCNDNNQEEKQDFNKDIDPRWQKLLNLTKDN